MYHIKNDKRSLSTAKSIEMGMYECLKTKSLNEITISDIHHSTGISRATFYRLFDTTEDVLIYMCDQYIEELRKYFSKISCSNTDDTGLLSFHIFTEKYEFQKILVDNHRQDLLAKIYAENFKFLGSQNTQLYGLNEMENEYIWELFYSNMSTVFSTWIQRGRKETPEELFALAKKYSELLGQLINI